VEEVAAAVLALDVPLGIGGADDAEVEPVAADRPDELGGVAVAVGCRLELLLPARWIAAEGDDVLDPGVDD